MTRSFLTRTTISTMPRTKRTARVSVGGKFPRKQLGQMVRRSPRTKTTGTSPAPLGDASAHASQSSAADVQLFEAAIAAAQLIKTAKDGQQTMADRWDSAVADTHKQLDGKPVVPAVKSEGLSDGTTTSSAEDDRSKPRSEPVLHDDLCDT